MRKRRRRTQSPGSGSGDAMDRHPERVLREDSTVSMISRKTERNYSRKFLLLVVLSVLLLCATLTFCVLYEVSIGKQTSASVLSTGNENGKDQRAFWSSVF